MARRGPIRSWPWATLALLAAALLLGTLERAPQLWFALLPYLQPHITVWYVGVGALATGLLLLWAWSAGPTRRWLALLTLVGLLALYCGLLMSYYAGEPPAKRIHLLEYGLLAGLALQAVRVESTHHQYGSESALAAPLRGSGLLLAAVFLFLVGTLDETAQGFLPTRTFRWLDLFGNYFGSCLGALAWSAASPNSPWRSP